MDGSLKIHHHAAPPMGKLITKKKKEVNMKTDDMNPPA